MAVFIDTGIIVALYNERDALRPKAVEIMKQVSNSTYGAVYTSEYIVDEAVTLLFIRTGNRNLSKDLAKRLLLSKSMELLHVDENTFKESGSRYLAQREELSFTDCTTVELMKQNEIEFIATFDAEFKKVHGIKAVD